MKYFWEDFGPAVIVTVMALAILVGCFYAANHTSGAQCADRAEMMKMAYSYSWRVGCMVTVRDGSWVPMSSVRVTR